MTSIGRPYQYMQSFRVYWQDTEVMDDGMVVKVSKNDVLLLGDDPCHDRKFIVKGTKDPAGTGQFSIYYVLERSDTDGRRS